jgi:nicotinate phosphoribosyltransferase
MAWSGLRVDSGENIEIFNLYVSLYEENAIRPETKQVIFSNALDVDSAIDIHNKVNKRVIDGYGIGTHFTNDFKGLCKKLGRPITLLISMDYPDKFLRGKELKLEALNMVIKMVAARLGIKDWWHKIAKLSFDSSKATGSPEAIAMTRAQIPENSEMLDY